MLIAATMTVMIGSLARAQSPQVPIQDNVLTHHGTAE
jgi:hypothetical protein